jgi:hypothetical protein
MKNKIYEIDQKLANDIINYLSQKPYIEVFELIARLQQLKEIKKEEN